MAWLRNQLLTHTDTQEKIMTPYELRFNIFCKAQEHLLEHYHSSEGSRDYPSYEEIEELAKKINSFVSG